MFGFAFLGECRRQGLLARLDGMVVGEGCWEWDEWIAEEMR